MPILLAMGVRIASSVICIATLVGTAGPVRAAPPQGPSLNPRTHGFMLYISQPIGGGPSIGGPRFGLRFEQVRMGGNNGAPDAGNPMQHRALVGWQFGGQKATDMRLELGGRVTYDVLHGGFALQSNAHIPQPVRSISKASFASLRGAKPFDVHEPDEHGFSSRTAVAGGMRESASLLHEIAAAAVVRLHPMHPTPNAHINEGPGSRPHVLE
jgi:hypothetical protein